MGGARGLPNQSTIFTALALSFASRLLQLLQPASDCRAVAANAARYVLVRGMLVIFLSQGSARTPRAQRSPAATRLGRPGAERPVHSRLAVAWDRLPRQ